MRFIIICAGMNDFTELYNYQENDYVITVDGGYKYAKMKNIIPNVHLGDDDSFIDENNLSAKDNILKYNPIKDESDLELAVNYIINNYKNTQNEILIYNATGNRLDHFFAAVRLLYKYSNLNMKIINKTNEMFIINDSYTFYKDNHKYISFFNYVNNTIISLKGFKYNLENYKMKKYDNLCLSNEIDNNFNNNCANVTVNKPILCIKSSD